MKIWENILDFIWPKFCLSCHQEGSFCCQNCQQNIQLLPLDYEAWTDNKDFVFDKCYVCLDFQEALTKKLIKTFKYSYIQSLSEILASILWQQVQRINLPANTVITNIPLHLKKKKQRGFDQTEILAKKLSEKTRLPYLALLTRIKFNKTQAQLDKASRLVNVQDIFKINPKTQADTQATVLLIDDIATTGATLNEAAKILKSAGYQHIIALVLAKN